MKAGSCAALAATAVLGISSVAISSGDAPSHGVAVQSGVAPCESAALGEADPKWRSRSSVAGPFGFYGDGRNFKKWAFKRTDGKYASKIPVIVEGDVAVTVWIVARHRGRVGLQYGFGYGRNGRDEFRFEPCGNRTRTGWPGGFVLGNLKPVSFKVLVDGSAEPFRVTVGKRKPR